MTAQDPLTLDVRPHLARGEEPFALIMAATDSLAPGQALRLIAPFRPAPLFTVMANRGYGISDRKTPDGAWEVVFTPLEGNAEGAGLAPGSSPEAMLWPDPEQVLDLTGLAESEANARALAAIGAMAGGSVLFALFDDRPMSLLPELAIRHHEWAGNAAADGSGYRLLIRSGARSG